MKNKNKRDTEEPRENPLSEAMSDLKIPASQETKPFREIDEQTQKHIDRFLQGKDVWNQWANEMLAKKEELEKAGKWKVKEDLDSKGHFRTMSASPSIPEIQEWLDESYIDFSYISFQIHNIFSMYSGASSGKNSRKLNNIELFPIKVEYLQFSGLIFPGTVSFINTEFSNTVHFLGSKFIGSTYFIGAKFSSSVIFYKSEFFNISNFTEVQFKMESNFCGVEFHKKTSFSKAIFSGTADFNKSSFKGIAYFRLAIFESTAGFSEAKFFLNGDFRIVNFKKYVNFSKAIFKRRIDFEAILVERAFSLRDAKFISAIPDFTQANFLESPRLDHLKVLPIPNLLSPFSWQRYFWTKNFIQYIVRFLKRLFWSYPKYLRSKFANSHRNPDEEAHYRALKRLAIQAHDHENEMKFFAGEIRARRHITDFMWPWKKGIASSARYWAGVFYEAFSDFGRSFIRPIAYWGITFFIFANLTLSNAGLEDKTKCHNSQLTPKQAAYTIGLKNSLLILGLTKTNIVKQAELCLYGVNKNGEAEREPKPYDPKIKRAYHAKPTKTENTKTDIPFKAAVQGITHSGLSLLFIFLLLLAIRNQFKIK